jgi:GNAT superfamily N-acetyltransferase
MIRRLAESERDVALAVINDAAIAYRESIPADCWHEPYFDRDYLDHEIGAGVEFFAFEADGGGFASGLLGVMGIQDVADVTLIRHAYVRTSAQRRGVGSALLGRLRSRATRPILIGTWAAATWAVSFYERNGFSLVSPAEKNRLLGTYWDIPVRQIETSVVLADERALREIVRDAHDL